MPQLLQLFKNLVKCSERLASVGSLAELARSLEEILVEVLEVEHSALYLFDPIEDRLRLFSALGFSEEERAEAERTAMERHPGHVYRTKEILIVPDVDKDTLRISVSSKRSFHIGARLYVPVMLNGKCIGAFGIVHTAPRQYSETEIESLKFVASLAAIAYARLRKEDERKQVVEELLIQHQAVLASHNGIVFSDPSLPDNPIVFVNPAFERLTGYTAAEVMGRNCRFLQGEYRNQPALKELREAIVNKKSCKVTVQNVRKDGTTFWNELSVSPIVDDTGEVKRFVGIQTDITARVVAEEQLQAFAQRLSGIIENIHGGILVENEHRRIMLVNQEFCSLFGITDIPATLIGTDCSHSAEQTKHLFTEPEVFEEAIARIVAGRKPTGADVLQLADGRHFEREYVPLIIGGEFKGHLWQYRDVSDRVHTQINLEKRNKQRTDLLDIAHSLLGTLSTKDITSIFADGMSRLFEFDTMALYTPDEEKRLLKPLVVRGVQFVSEELEEWFVPMDSGVVGSVVRSMTAERINNAHRDPRSFYPPGASPKQEHLMVFPVRVGRRLFGVLMVARLGDVLFSQDDFELTRFFVEYVCLALENASLFDRISANQEELSRSKDVVEESLKAKEKFFARMSHEIRTPMNGIIGLTNLLLQTELTPDQTDLIRNLKLSGDNLLVIINDILDLAKLEAGKVRLIEKDFSIAESIAGIVNIMKSAVDERGIKLESWIDQDVPRWLTGDPVRLHQILLNLVSNAVKFTEHGYVWLSVHMLQANAIRPLLEFRVEDTGIGIPADALQHLFKSFSQVESTLQMRTTGTGLGLAIVKQLTELQGGTVNVSSEPGKGTTFTVRLPILRCDTSPREDGAVTKGDYLRPLTGVKILIAEDNLINQQVAARTLALWSIKSVLVENGKRAVEMARSEHFDMILMDIQMPEMNGLDATMQIRRSGTKHLQSIPIIAMTASVTGDIEGLTRKAGMTDYISKPFEPSVLHAKIVHYLNREDEPIVEMDAEPNVGGDFGSLTYLLSISGGDEPFIADMIETFREQSAVLLEAIRRACANSDGSGAAKEAHKLKPILGMVGMNDASRRVQEFMDKANSGVLAQDYAEEIDGLATECESRYRMLKQDFKRWQNAQTGGQPAL